MNKSKLLIIGTLPGMWIIYFLFELISGNLTNTYEILMNLSISILFLGVGYILYLLYQKYKTGLSSKKLWLIFIILMLLDQGIKLIIKLFFFDNRFEVIPKFLSFHPIINTQGSWLNVRFNTGINFGTLIILNIIAMFFFIEFYRYFTQRFYKDFWTDLCFIFIIAGCLCSLIDKIFYGGSLDFIAISNLFIADIKDIYINIAIFSFILASYFSGFLSSNDKGIKNDLNEIKNFFIFIKNDIKRKNK